MIKRKLEQNFSNTGSRMTSAEPLSNLNLRDKILTSFSMYDKSNLEKNRSRSLLSMYKESPVKDNAYLMPAPIQSNTKTTVTEAGLSDINNNSNT